MTKFFLDTEFIERAGHPIELISIGIVCANGEELYEVSSEFDPNHANLWVQQNVLAQIRPDAGPGRPREGSPLRIVAERIQEFVNRNRGSEPPEFWGYYADYDWVVFAQIFGTMMDLPAGWPMYCRDLKQWCDELGNPKLPDQSSAEHNALNDARWNAQVFQFLATLGTSNAPDQSQISLSCYLRRWLVNCATKGGGGRRE